MSNIDKQALRRAAMWIRDEIWVHAGNGEVVSEEYVANGETLVDHICNCEVVGTSSLRAEFIAAANPATVLALLDELEAAEKRLAELEALGSGVKQFSEFQICHYGATEDYAKGYIDCQNNYNKVLFAAAGKGE